MAKVTISSSWHNFLNCCLKLNNLQQAIDFFDIFLTLSEKEEIANRLQIIKELVKGEKTQRQIAKDLKVSIANVSRGSNVLKMAKPSIEQLLNCIEINHI